MLEYNGEIYRLKNMRLYLNDLEKKELKIFRENKLSYTIDSMCNILEKILQERRRPLNQEHGNLLASEFIEITLSKELLSYYLFYTAYASSLYFEQKIVNKTIDFQSSIQPSELLINSIGLDALCLPTYVIKYANSYLLKHKILPKYVTMQTEMLSTQISRYIAQIAILKENNIFQQETEESCILSEAKIEKDTHHICKQVFYTAVNNTKIKEENLLVFDESEMSINFEKKSLLQTTKLDLTKSNYHIILKAEEVKKENKHILEIKNRYNLCYKLMFTVAVIPVSIYYLFPIIIGTLQ